jgi:hypothetical protein
MQTFYEGDVKLIASLSQEKFWEFEAWIIDLEDEMDRMAERKNSPRVYARPLAESTGLECWASFFEDDMTPNEAIEADMESWTE